MINQSPPMQMGSLTGSGKVRMTFDRILTGTFGMGSLRSQIAHGILNIPKRPGGFKELHLDMAVLLYDNADRPSRAEDAALTNARPALASETG